MNARVDRKLPNRFVRFFMRAVKDETGVYTLRLMLRNAGLERYIPDLPENNIRLEILASEYAALHFAIRNYFGNGARGSLNRMGRATWGFIHADSPLGQRLVLWSSKLLPAFLRLRLALRFLAATMRAPDGEVSVHLLDKDLIFMDTSSDSTVGQTAEGPICWMTAGLIQGAVNWATGAEQGLDEISCRATGAMACRYRIKLEQ